MKVAMVGSRTFQDLERVQRHVTKLPADTEIITGGAVGVDQAAECAARARGLKVTVIRPDYATHGRIAPLRRNRAIVEAAGHVVAYWDGLSGGTANAIAWAAALGKGVTVHFPEASRAKRTEAA